MTDAQQSGARQSEAGSPARRIAVVVAIYIAVAWVVLGVTDWARRVLVLPELFDTLLRGGIVVGLPLAALLAWKYPELGHGDRADHGDYAEQGDHAVQEDPAAQEVRPAGNSNES